MNAISKPVTEPPRKIKLKANLEDSQSSSLHSSMNEESWSKNLVDNIIPSFTGREKEPQETDTFIPISILGKSYKWIWVIIEEILSILVDEADPTNLEDFIEPLPHDPKDPATDMRHLMGYLNQNLYHDYLNITHIMRLKKMDFRDLYGIRSPDLMLTRENLIERIMLTITSYFCMGTELRFLKVAKEEGFEETKDDELWHGKSL